LLLKVIKKKIKILLDRISNAPGSPKNAEERREFRKVEEAKESTY
jgi:hypothetical protein